MLTFVIRRIAYSIPVLLLASLLVFVFVHATSDPLARYAQSRDLTIKAKQGLAEGIYEKPCRMFTAGQPPVPAETCTKAPVLKQYWYWLSHFLRGKMGKSFVTDRAISSDLKSAFGNTLQLIIWGVLVSALLAVSVGVFSAVRQYSVPDYIFTGLSFIGLSLPTFWFGLIAIDLFANRLSNLAHKHLPVIFGHGHNPLVYSLGLHGSHAPGLWAATQDYSRHLVLPVATLTVQIVASWSRYERSSMLDVLSADYIRTATAKGLSRARVIFRHALRNALIPLVTVMALDIGGLFGGLVVTEQIFSVHGMGFLFLNDLGNGDTQALLPWLMITATFVVAFNLLADVLYGVLDPRIRLA
jgi:peptide/nickel transport system permease protein